MEIGYCALATGTVANAILFTPVPLRLEHHWEFSCCLGVIQSTNVKGGYF